MVNLSAAASLKMLGHDWEELERSFMLVFFFYSPCLPLLSLILFNQPATALNRELRWWERSVLLSASKWVTFALAASGKS